MRCDAFQSFLHEDSEQQTTSCWTIKKQDSITDMSFSAFEQVGFDELPFRLRTRSAASMCNGKRRNINDQHKRDCPVRGILFNTSNPISIPSRKSCSYPNTPAACSSDSDATPRLLW